MIQKIYLIIYREFITRVRKKSFIVITLLGPILFAAMIILPLYFATLENKEIKHIAVIDSSKVFIDKIPDTKGLKFHYIENVKINKFIENFQDQGYWGVLFISHIVTYSPNSVTLYSYSQTGLAIQYHIENAIKKEIERLVLQANGIEGLDKTLESLKSNVNLRMIKLDEKGKQTESNTELAMIVGYATGLLIYLFILLFGSQVMRGVIEEKSNRIVEVIISSVKPFELMMGKILGIAAVAMLQFFLWISLSYFLVSIGQQVFFPNISKNINQVVVSQDIMNTNPTKVVSKKEVQVSRLDISKKEETSNNKVEMVFDALKKVNYVSIIFSFIFFFLGGYLLYAAIFAAIGSMVDNESDTQQLVFPITIPLILALYVMINTINNPESNLSFWFSMIPFTSSVVMMVRIAFGVPYWQVIMSILILVISFIFFTYMAAKIYRTGILMYGKKITYKELWKWLKHD